MNYEDMAGFFIEGWYVFDNFAPFQVEWKGKLYPTSEHAYQAAHFFATDAELAEKIRLCRSPREAADLATEYSTKEDPDWKAKRVAVMEEIVRLKLQQHPYIQEVLRESGSRHIVEMNDADGFWGWGSQHDGRNELGNIWMRLREEYKN